jgi:pimeloyl-ACP methyl ester carboxylesterase
LFRNNRRTLVSPTPLLFVHGAWHAAWCWQPYFLPYFAQHGYACYALSLRGHGSSQGKERLRWWRVADYVADVTQVAASLPAPPIVIGHSAGGFIVQKYLEAHPAPAAVLLASVAPSGLLPIVLTMAARHPLVFLRALPALDMRRLVGTPELSREWLFSADMPADQVARFAEQMQNESFLAFLDMACCAWCGAPGFARRCWSWAQRVTGSRRRALSRPRPEPTARRCRSFPAWPTT